MVTPWPVYLLTLKFSLVSQDPFLWHSSVRYNLDPEENCTDEEMWAALDLVGAKEAIAELPHKLDTIFEDVESLSHGQVEFEDGWRLF